MRFGRFAAALVGASFLWLGSASTASALDVGPVSINVDTSHPRCLDFNVTSRSLGPIVREDTCIQLQGQLAYVHRTPINCGLHCYGETDTVLSSHVVAPGVATDRTQLTLGPDDTSPAWSPDDSKIAFVRGTGQAGVWAMNADGLGQHFVASGGAPSWSPDGTRLAFSGGFVGSPAITIINADGTGAHQILLYPTDQPGPPVWSPDGTMFAFWNYTPAEFSGEVRVIRVDGTGEQLLANDAIWGGSPFSYLPRVTWSPDSTRVAYAWGSLGSTAEGLAEAFLSAPGSSGYHLTDSSDPTRSYGFAQMTNPAWSKDNALAFDASTVTPTGISASGIAVYDLTTGVVQSVESLTTMTPSNATVDVPLLGPTGSGEADISPAWGPVT